ncbi:hypothetical protein [Flavobacterium sp.]|uniref:hypothetical protein n=1 Tax=Flavobacterium sp. TaxID=239 RepID=UPI00286B2274|nr:hypothetical protein [Flavobacterium sp.]
MKLHLNYTQSFQLGNNVPETPIYSNIIPEIQDKATAKKSVHTKAKRFLNKLSPLHWYDGVWDDLNFDV